MLSFTRLRTERLCCSKDLLLTCPWWQQLAHSDYEEDARVVLGGVTHTVSVPQNNTIPRIYKGFMKQQLIRTEDAKFSNRPVKQKPSMWVRTTLQIYYRPNKCLVLKNTKKNTTQEGTKQTARKTRATLISIITSLSSQWIPLTQSIRTSKWIRRQLINSDGHIAGSWQRQIQQCYLHKQNNRQLVQTDRELHGRSTTTLQYFKQLCTSQ